MSLEKELQQVYNKLSRNVKGRMTDSPMLEVFCISMNEIGANITQEQIDHYSMTVPLPQEAKRGIESILYHLSKERENIHKVTRFEMCNSVIGRIASKYTQEFGILQTEYNTYFGTKNHTDLLQKTRALLYRTSRNMELDPSQVIDALIFIQSNMNSSNVSDENWELTAVEVLYAMVIIALSMVGLKGVPLYVTAQGSVHYLPLSSKPFATTQKEYLDLLASGSEGTRLSIFLECCIRAMTQQVVSILRYIAVTNSVCNDFTLPLLEVPHLVITSLTRNIPDTFDNALRNQIGSLHTRTRLLPPQGIVFDSSILSNFVTFEKGSQEMAKYDVFCGQKIFYLNELVTDAEELYLVIRIEEETSQTNHVMVYSPVQGKPYYMDACLDEDNEVTYDTSTLAVCLLIYNYITNLLDYSDIDYSPDDTDDIYPTFRYGSFLDDENFVNHYVRRLPSGNVASPGAKNSAKCLGIALRDDQEYVYPYFRTIHKKPGHTSKPKPISLNALFVKEGTL